MASIAGAMKVASGDTDVAKCAVAGAGLNEATVGKDAMVVVTACDFKGNGIPSGGDVVEATLAPTAGGRGGGAGGAETSLDCTVVDNIDGAYTCSYTPIAAAGGWELEVKVNGEHAAQSLFAVTVCDAANGTD